MTQRIWVVLAVTSAWALGCGGKAVQASGENASGVSTSAGGIGGGGSTGGNTTGSGGFDGFDVGGVGTGGPNPGVGNIVTSVSAIGAGGSGAGGMVGAATTGEAGAAGAAGTGGTDPELLCDHLCSTFAAVGCENHDAPNCIDLCELGRAVSDDYGCLEEEDARIQCLADQAPDDFSCGNYGVVDDMSLCYAQDYAALLCAYCAVYPEYC
jgi:hypothetical protein